MGTPVAAATGATVGVAAGTAFSEPQADTSKAIKHESQYASQSCRFFVSHSHTDEPSFAFIVFCVDPGPSGDQRLPV